MAEARDSMVGAVAAGVSTAELDDVGREVLTRHGARSAPQLAYDFPGTTCISVNHDMAHGIPSPDRVLADGDLVNIDVSAELDGYWTDTGISRRGRRPRRADRPPAHRHPGGPGRRHGGGPSRSTRAPHRSSGRTAGRS